MNPNKIKRKALSGRALRRQLRKETPVMSGEDIVKGRKKIRAVVKTKWNETDIDRRYAAVKAMELQGAVEIRDFHEVKPTPKEYNKHGKKIHAFEATAVPSNLVVDPDTGLVEKA